MNKEAGRGRKDWMALCMKICAGMLALSLAARFLTGYIVRCWNRFTRGRDLSVDVIAPKYGPVLVVSADDDEDPFGRILEDGYHTQTFLRLARLELVRRTAVLSSLLALLTSFFLWLFSEEE
ncbi:MAG: hypothetical protein HFG27_10190 [Provencibacterium sp.]|jgi:hypothetical protein|nr:hypothetical protein [Provencibacterium sp.]